MMTHNVMIVLLSLLTTYSDAACVITNCAECNGNSSSECFLCNDGYWLESGLCIQCPSQCSVCTHSSQCQSCMTSRWNPPQLCGSVCDPNCENKGCNDTTGYCYECKSGKYGPNCKQDCSLCTNGICDLRKYTYGCKDGYLQSSTEYSYCHSCNLNCIKCSNTTYCTQCEQGFYRDYFRHPRSGRGNMFCKQCWEPCTQCTSNDQCPEECKSECTKQACDESGGCVTTRSTSGTTAASKTKSSNTSKVIRPLTIITNNPNPSQTNVSGQTTHQPRCPNKCKDNCDAYGTCHITAASNSKHVLDYYEAFGHGIATGIGILIVVGTLIGVVTFFIRRTKCHRKICPTKSTKCSRETHVYVNSQEEAGTMPTSRNRPLHNETNTDSEIHATLSEEDVDTNREYVSLGERQPEHHYSDLQTNRRDDQ